MTLKKLTPSRENLSGESDNKKSINKSFFGLEQSREELNFKIDATNNELKTAGRSILQVAKLLFEIKILLKNKNWVDLTESGLLTLSGRIARDLASAYENWLKDSSIPEEALTQVSARTLARIGKVAPSKRIKIETQLKNCCKYTESDLSNFLRQPKATKPVDELN